ncbi:MAG TPA: alpha/beta fold hydrolase [Methylomirabilota bacterium]|nr:alpha/beta fold hydrolase [Methylomirabilota bacterium]
MGKAALFFLSALLLLMAGSAWIALYPTVPADLGGVANLDASATRVRIPVDEADSLDAWYLRGSQPAAVVLFAGYARDHRRMWRYAGFLHKQGFHVLTFDFRSARATARKPTTLGYWEVRDARAALDWLRGRPGLTGARIGFLGESLGGATALAVAAERPDVTAVVADCPFSSADEAIADGFGCVLHLPRWPLAPFARQVGRIATGHDIGALDVTKAVRKLSGRPVLLIQTRRGDRFSATQVDRLTASLGANGETWNVDDVKHTEAWLHYRDEYERRVSHFFAEHLGTTWTAAPVSARAPGKHP